MDESWRKWSKINLYFGKIIEKRCGLPNPEESALLQLFDSDSAPQRLEDLLDELASSVENFEGIFSILPEINNVRPDGKIDDVIAELRAARYLHRHGYLNLRNIPKKKKRKTPDFSCQKDGQLFCVEVKFIRGDDFKAMERVDNNPALGFRLDSHRLKVELESKVEEGVAQLAVAGCSNTLLIIATNRLEADKFWFGKEVEERIVQLLSQAQSKLPSLRGIVFLPDSNAPYEVLTSINE